MSTMILHSLEIIRLKKKEPWSPHRQKVLLDEIWSIAAWSSNSTKNFKTLYSYCFGDPELQFFNTDGPVMGNRMMKQLHWACTARGALSGGWLLKSTYSCPQFCHHQQTWKDFKLHTVYSQILVQLQWQTSSQSSCLSSGTHSQKFSQKTIKGFDCKINGLAYGAVLLHSLGGSDWQAQRQGIS